MATADEYAAWIVKNADKKGTPAFNTVAAAYQDAKKTLAAPAAPASSSEWDVTDGPRIDGIPPAATTGSTQPGTMGAYTTRRPAPSKTPNMFNSVPQPEAEAAGYSAALRGLLSGALGIPGAFESMITPEAPVGSPLRGHETIFPTPAEVRQGFSRMGWTEPTSEEGKASQLGGELAPAIYGVASLAPAVVGGSVKIARGIGSNLADVVNPSRLKGAAVAEVLNNDPALIGRVKALLDQGKTIQEAAVLTNSQGLAALVDKAKNSTSATQTLYTAIDDAAKLVQTNKLATAAANVNALTQQNLPIATASPTAPRRAVKQALAGEAATLQGQKAAMTGQLTAEQQAAEAALQAKQASLTGQLTAEQQAAEAALAAQRQGVEGGIANVSQLETGDTLTKANKAIQTATQQTVVTPAYNAAFKAAPGATINLNGLASVAEEQLGTVLAKLKGTGMAPNASVLLERYAPRQVETMVQGVPVKTVQSAKPVTFEEASDISKAIGMDINKLKGLNDPAANYARANLQELDSALNAAIKKGVPEEAFNLYNTANSIFKDRIIGVHRTGQVANLRRTSTLNEAMLRPDAVVKTAMADEGNTVQFLKVFEQDPAAMQTFKTGVEDLYRQSVLSGGKAATPEAHAKFMSDYARQLGALDKAGMGMTKRLDQIGGQIKGVTSAEQTLAAQGKAIPSKVAETLAPETQAVTAQGKAIPSKVSEAFKAEDEALNLASTTLGFKQTDKLRSAIISDPEVASQALSRMGAPAKSSLARGVMQDAGKASDPLKHLTDNEDGILRVLRSYDPKTAQATFDQAKELAELSNLVKQAGNKLGVTTPKNALASQQNLDKLTQGLPEVKAAVKDIQTRIAQGEKFEELAAKGSKAIDSPLKLFSDETKPNILPLNRIMSFVNAILNRLQGRIDKKLAVDIATELSNSVSAAKLVGGAQARELAKVRSTNALANASKAPGMATLPASINALASDRNK